MSEKRVESIIFGNAIVSLIFWVVFVMLMFTDQPVWTGWVIVGFQTIFGVIVALSITAYVKELERPK